MSSFKPHLQTRQWEIAGPKAIGLRPATAADDAVLLAIYASTRAEELAPTGWDDAACAAFVQMQFKAQCLGYRQVYPRSEHSLIEVRCTAGPQVAGRLWLNRTAACVHVLDISMLPPWRSQGIGGHCLQQLIAEVCAGGGALSLHVQTGNPARRLYERLGFQPRGPLRGVHQRMVWQPAAPSPLQNQESCHEQA